MTTSPADVLDELLATRWSCRAFLPDPVPREVVEQVLRTAGRAPSWCNTQPWHVHVLDAAATDRFRAALAERLAVGFTTEPDLPFPASYDGVYAERRRTSAFALYDSVGITRGDRTASGLQTLKNFDLFGAPHLMVVTTDAALGTYGAVDCGLFLQALLLAAHSHGIATIAQAALATQAPFLREHLGLTEDRRVLVGVSFGYADEADPVNGYRTERQSLDELATWVG